MDLDLFDYSPITDRPKLEWPNGARVAFYVGLNIEHFYVDRPGLSMEPGTANLVPDPLNYGWRDYGSRVGIWRVIDALDRYKVRASVLLNSDVCDRYPQIVRAGLDRDWAWLAHGKSNSTFQTGMSTDDEREYLKEVVQIIEGATGASPRGWLGPALTETFDTPRLLAELGLTYTLDWNNDDQPVPTKVPGMLSVPYNVDYNDISVFINRGMTGAAFVQILKDQFDQLYAESSESGRVMPLALHPFVIGQAFRHKYLEEALDYITSHDGVWVTTSDEIAEHYAAAISS